MRRRSLHGQRALNNARETGDHWLESVAHLVLGSAEYNAGNFRQSVEHLVRNVEFLMVTLRRELPGARLLLQSVMPRGREFAEQTNLEGGH